MDFFEELVKQVEENSTLPKPEQPNDDNETTIKLSDSDMNKLVSSIIDKLQTPSFDNEAHNDSEEEEE